MRNYLNLATPTRLTGYRSNTSAFGHVQDRLKNFEMKCGSFAEGFALHATSNLKAMSLALLSTTVPRQNMLRPTDAKTCPRHGCYTGLDMRV
jgi:hypothetical protein